VWLPLLPPLVLLLVLMVVVLLPLLLPLMGVLVFPQREGVWGAGTARHQWTGTCPAAPAGMAHQQFQQQQQVHDMMRCVSCR
jgi:hypothetical protein